MSGPYDDDDEIPKTRQHSLPPERRRSTLVLTEAQMRGEAPIEPAAAVGSGYTTLEDPDDEELATSELLLEGVPLFEEDEATLPHMLPPLAGEAADGLEESAATGLREMPEAAPRRRPQMTRAEQLEEFDSASIVGRPPRE